MNIYWLITLIVVGLILPLECIRFYRESSRGELNWWTVFDIFVSLSLIAAAITYGVRP